MIATTIDTNTLQKSVAAEEGGNLMTLPERVPIDQIAPPVSDETPPPSFMNSILSAAELREMDIPECEPLVGSWWREGNIGFLFGQRGKGKSWMGLHLARCLAEGRDCGPWRITKPRRVLYVDGEMTLDALKSRSEALGHKPDALLYFLSYQQHFNKTRTLLNVADPAAQRGLLEACQEMKIEVLVLDNISCLLSGISENEADAWEPIRDYLRGLKAFGVSVCLVHHAGRSGAHMRGTSRREDGADWVMQVAATDDDEPPEVGYRAKFVTDFTKYRTCTGEDAGPWEWVFETPAEGEPTTVRWGLLSRLNLFMRLIEEDGLESCSDIAEAMGLSKSTVSKLAKRAKAQKLIAVEGSGNQGRYTSIRVPQLS